MSDAQVFSFSTKRPMMTVEMDGVLKQLPLSLTSDEFKTFTTVNGAAIEKDADSLDAEMVEQLLAWFIDFASTYLGDDFRLAGTDVFIPLMKLWIEKYAEANGGVSVGER